jgi:hypothetical protein
MKNLMLNSLFALSSLLLAASMHLPENHGGIGKGDVEAIKTTVLDKAAIKDGATEASVRCFINEGIIMTFPSSIPDLLREDILSSVLLAQKGADKKTSSKDYQFNRNTRLEEWVDFFNTVMANVAWIFQTPMQKPIDMPVKSATFTLSDLALDIMGRSSSTASDVNMFRNVFKTFNALPNDNTAVKVFTGKTYEPTSHDTTVIVASLHQETPNSDPLMNLLLLNLRGVRDSTARPLSHTYTTKYISTKKMLLSQQVFNQGVYSHVRAEVSKKLKPYIQTDIKEIDLMG